MLTSSTDSSGADEIVKGGDAAAPPPVGAGLARVRAALLPELRAALLPAPEEEHLDGLQRAAAPRRVERRRQHHALRVEWQRRRGRLPHRLLLLPAQLRRHGRHARRGRPPLAPHLRPRGQGRRPPFAPWCFVVVVAVVVVDVDIGVGDAEQQQRRQKAWQKERSHHRQPPLSLCSTFRFIAATSQERPFLYILVRIFNASNGTSGAS